MDPASNAASNDSGSQAKADAPLLWRPDKIFLNAEAVQDPMTKRILSRLPQTPVEILSGNKETLPEFCAQLDVASRIAAGKRALHLSHHRGSWLKPCPGTTQHTCCNLWVINQAQGCPFDCTYCCLQHYLQRNPATKLHTNTAPLFSELKSRFQAEKSRLFRVCTGELTDSLALDSYTDFSLELVPFFACFSNALLELKTKSSFVDNLIRLQKEHNDRTVVSWSVNAHEVVEADEAGTAPLEERIKAAARVVRAGYRVGFHFDPLVPFAGWEEAYRAAIRMIFEAVPAKRTAWVSISPLRYHPDQQQLMTSRFPASRLPFVENFAAKDNKLRLFQPLRLKMIRLVWEELKKIDDRLKVYLCMESRAAWQAVGVRCPGQSELLSEVFGRKALS